MKKIFTLAAAVLASFSLWAVEPDLAINTESQGTENFVKAYETEGITLSSTASFSSGAVQLGNTPSSYDQHYFEVLAGSAEIDSISFLISGNGSNKSIQAPLFGWAETATSNTADTYVLLDPKVVTANSYAAAQWFTYDLSNAEVKCARIYRTTKNVSSVNPEYTGSSTALGSGQTIKIYGLKVWLSNATPSTDPVGQVTIAGPEAVYVGKAATYAATTDVKADEYKWFVNDVEQEGAETKNFEYTPEAEGTFNIVCKAKNANNTDWVVSNTIALVASVRPTISDLVVVDNDIVWDFNNAAAATIAAENQNDTVIFFNAGEWAEGFAADKIAGRGQYYYYSDNKCFQGHVLKFVTSVAGNIVVEFSNTGKPERPYRHLFVNGADTEYKSNSTTKVTTDAIAVPAGEVVLCGMMENGEDPMTLNMLRFYKITFTKDQEGGETAIENAEEAVKAVKFFQNGQLMIEKNGVIYNAQGAIVK